VGQGLGRCVFLLRSETIASLPGFIMAFEEHVSYRPTVSSLLILLTSCNTPHSLYKGPKNLIP